MAAPRYSPPPCGEGLGVGGFQDRRVSPPPRPSPTREEGESPLRPASPSPIRSVELEVRGDLAFPAVAIREQALLVVVELLARLSGELEVRPLDDGIDRTRLLAQPAIDALHHVDVVARGAAGAVIAPRAGLDGDRLRRADRLAQLAGNAALLAVRITAQRMLAAEARRDRVLLERIVQCRLWLEEIAHGEHKRR